MITKTKNNFTFAYFSIDNLSKENFIEFIVNNFNLYTTYSILVKLSFDNQLSFKMSGYQIGLVIKNKHDIDYYEKLYQVILIRIGATCDNYNLSESLDGIELIYTVIKGIPELSLKNISELNLPKKLTNINETKDNFNSKLLPLTIDTRYYGTPLFNDIKLDYINKINENLSILNNKNYIPITKTCDLFLYQKTIKTGKLIIASIKISENVYVKQVFNESTCLLLLKAVDTIYNTNFFERQISNVSLSIEKQKIIKVKIVNKLKPITDYKITKTVKAISERNNQFGTLDLETFLDTDGLSKVYAIGFITNKDSKANLFYLTDLSDILDSELLVLTCIDKMLNKKYNNFIFYTHNFGKFDCIFIFNALKKANLKKGFEYYILKPTIRDDTIIKLDIKLRLTIKETARHIKISIVDSLNLLNNSLDKLTKDFKVKNKKGVFPYTFVNRDKLNYIGLIPDKKYYNNISELEYNKLYKDKWNLKQESLSYLENDLTSHLSVMNEFSKTLYLEFNIQLTDSLTISRLALNIFMKRYLADSKLPLINNYNIFNFIKSGYYGGITEVYKPFGKDLIYIDVNSLYPFAALKPMPGTDCQYIESLDTSGLDLNNLFGFFYAKVKTNDNLVFGLLPLKTDNGLIFPQGEFKGVWCSEELKFAKENGYKITVIKGYNFNKVNSYFKSFVQDLYEMKSNNTGSLKMTAKSLLNNLLGRFGLSMIKPITKTVNKQTRDYIASTRKIISQKFVTDNDFLLTFDPIISKDICIQHGLDYSKVVASDIKKNLENKLETFQDISIAISAFVTAYARIFMYQKKLEILKNGGTVYYTDTDSLVTDKTYINQSWIGNKIGQFKLEFDIKEAYFISNKTYCLVLNTDQTVIKAKGVLNNSLTLDDFKNMYLNKSNVNTIRSNTITNYEKGSVNIGTTKLTLSFDSYTKRTKIYNNEGLWINTKPLLFTNKTEA